MSDPLFVITISHQFGSGGAMLGQELAERLGVPFFDRQILKRVADDLHLAEREVERREERLSTFWESFARNAVMGDPAGILAVDRFEPTDQELFDHECEIIGKIAQKSSGVFLGRCGFYTLRDHPRRVSFLLHGDLKDRVERVRHLFNMDEAAATKMIENNDRDRAAYVRAFTREDWLDAHHYDLAMNTSSLGMEKAIEFAMGCAVQKLGLALPHRV